MFSGVIDTVGTTGSIQISPNTVNSVPRDAKLEIDVRDIDLKRRDAVVKQIISVARSIAEKRKVESSIEIVNQDPPATCSQAVGLSQTQSLKAFLLCYKCGIQTVCMLSIVLRN